MLPAIILVNIGPVGFFNLFYILLGVRGRRKE